MANSARKRSPPSDFRSTIRPSFGLAANTSRERPPSPPLAVSPKATFSPGAAVLEEIEGSLTSGWPAGSSCSLTAKS